MDNGFEAALQRLKTDSGVDEQGVRLFENYFKGLEKLGYDVTHFLAKRWELNQSSEEPLPLPEVAKRYLASDASPKDIAILVFGALFHKDEYSKDPRFRGKPILVGALFRFMQRRNIRNSGEAAREYCKDHHLTGLAGVLDSEFYQHSRDIAVAV